jgi:hypothetical protein
MGYSYGTYCGLYCGACEVMRANRRGTVARTAKKWGMKPADITCHGCKSTVLSIYCLKCDIKRCCVAKGVENCSACSRFPCPRIKNLNNDNAVHHSSVLRNLRIMGSVGVKAWLRRQDRRWRCKECGARFTWYAPKCNACGSVVLNSAAEEKALRKRKV